MGDTEKKVIGEVDFNLANYHESNQITEKVFLEPREGPGLFGLQLGEDCVEVMVKTVLLGDSETPNTTMAKPAAPNNTKNNRNSARRG